MLRKLPFLLLLIPALAALTSLSAQAAPDQRSTPNVELFGGYSYVFRPYDHTQTNPFTGGMNGWDASLKLPVPIFGSWLGVKGDVSGSYRNDGPDFNPHSYFFLLGPQVSVHLGRSTVFVHGLVGSAHLNNSALPNLKSNNTFAVAVGGGLDLGISRGLAWRVQADYYNTNYQSTNTNIREIVNSNGRFATGPVLRF
ncbi:MAG: outer membrane beta-barrel protein [Acidobacteriota bacterium]|nr:outer membrane beta-barrel protein [Acidobacteriota bacterium]